MEGIQGNTWHIYFRDHLLYMYLINIWSSHVRQNFLEISTLMREKKKEKLLTTVIIKKLD
jgi:hypothetical protein